MPTKPPPPALRDAREAGLRYANDADPGFRRVRRGRGFRYLRADGRPVRDPRALARIASLAVPPAWTDVWINADPRGHVQATGRDARGRKQSRYHARWREARNEVKFGRMIAFGRALPRLRAQVRRDLAASERLSHRVVVAAVVRLLDETLIRVGNDEYARENRSYGLTTLKDGHVARSGSQVVLRFPGKGGKEHEVAVSDPRAARVVRRCQDLPGQRLFQFLEPDGSRDAVGSDDVNAYLREATGEDFTAKDFRTWAGTVLALRHLGKGTAPKGVTRLKHAINEAVDAVADSLRNTRAVCRSSYIHPAVFEACEDRSLWAALERCAASGRCPRGLRRDEAVALLFLVQRGRAKARARAVA